MDATLMLWDASYMSGTYRIVVGGQAMLAGHGALSVNASSVQYDAATDTTFANQANVDAWINIPVRIDDDYVTKVAQLFKYGSDGVNPYTSAQANPVFPPLKPNLHLYLEYGNEVWNDSLGFFDAYSYNQTRALAESGTGTPINFDGPPQMPLG